MKQKFVLIFTFLLTAWCSSGQVADRYGVSLGTSYSRQMWHLNGILYDMDHDYKIGLQTFLFAEKDLGKMLSLRTELGYVQKGFGNEFEWITENGSTGNISKDNVVLHDLALDLGVKIRPFSGVYAPYIALGCRGDYMLSYKDAVIVEPGSGLEFNIYESTLSKFNRFNLGALLGLGVEFKDFLFFELEFNPNFTKNFESGAMSIKDKCWGAKLGVYINKTAKKK